ncbi:PQQ-binding-like beta-propeller repeat protein [Candidatus Marsarchaeota archaeon]|nr:PQQ-binding-like beta-propeller repeat protein [Candidatus Marsarchaeota archaeon]
MKLQNMKGFIFTLDAVFALIVTVAGISILLYVHSITNNAASIPASEASSILNNLLYSTPSSLYYSQEIQSITVNGTEAYTWPQAGHYANMSSNAQYGPKNAYTLFAFNTGSSVINTVVAAKGMVFAASGDYLYALNATSGKLEYSVNAESQIGAVPVTYENEVLLANSTGYIIAANIYNGSKLWSSDIGVAPESSYPILIEDGYAILTSGITFYVISPTNGSIIASSSVSAPFSAMPPIYADGEFMVAVNSSTQNYLYSFALAGKQLVKVWSTPLSAGPITMPIAVGNKIVIGSGTSLYTLSTGGSIIASASLSAPVRGIAFDGSNVYAETDSNIYAYNVSGRQIFSYPTALQSQDTEPSVSDGNLYTLIDGDAFQAYNISGDKMLWNATLPSSSQDQFANIALAYGNAYIASGTIVYAFGSYEIKPYTSILSALATMYLNGQGEIASTVLGNIYHSTNVGLFINDTYAPALRVSAFNGAYSSSSFSSTSYVYGTSHNIGGTNYNFTITMWVKPQPNPNTADSWTIPFFSMQSYQAFGFLSSGTGLVLHRCSSADTEGYVKGMTPSSVFNNQWHFVAVSVAYPNYYWQFDGNSTNDTNTNNFNSNSHISIGAQYMQCDGNQFNGQIANVQLYNSTLTPKQIALIRQEGIYGAPISYANLSGWWPMIGNANDYSGEYGVSVQNNVNYTEGPVPLSLHSAYIVSKASTPLSINVNGTNRIYNVSVVLWH